MDETNIGVYRCISPVCKGIFIYSLEIWLTIRDIASKLQRSIPSSFAKIKRDNKAGSSFRFVPENFVIMKKSISVKSIIQSDTDPRIKSAVSSVNAYALI